MEEIKTGITQVTADTEAGIRCKTAEMLPDNPTAAGMKAADIKAAFFKALTDGNKSLLSEIKRVINEANEVFSTEAQMRSVADINLNTELGAETAARELVDSQIKAAAVGVPNYNPLTGVLTFKTLAGNETEYDLPIEKIIEGVSLSEDGEKFIFKFHNSADIEVAVERLTNPAWETELKDSLIPPTTSAVKTAVDNKVEKLTPENHHLHFYGTNRGVGECLVRGAYNVAANALLMTDENSNFYIKGTPPHNTYPVSKYHFDKKTNNSLYLDHNALERRVANIEHASNGKIYETVTAEGKSNSVQVGDALPYGILSKIGGAVERLYLGFPFNLNFKDSYGITKESSNSFTINETKMAYIKCHVPAGAEVTVHCNAGSNVTGFGMFTLPNGTGLHVNKTAFGTWVTPTVDVDYIGIYRNNSLVSDIVNDFRISFSDPSNATVYEVTEEILFPDEITSLDGYGSEGSYLDLTERKFYRADGNAVDVSSYLPLENDVISLLPGVIIRFTDANEEAVAADYLLSYKNRIGG